MAHRLNQDPERVRQRRIEAGLSQQELAAHAGVSNSLISQVERGVCGASPKTLKRLAEVMACQVRDLMPEAAA